MSDGVPLQVCPVCGLPMEWRGTTTGWHGEYERTRVVWAHPAPCSVDVEVKMNRWVGPPSGEVDKAKVDA